MAPNPYKSPEKEGPNPGGEDRRRRSLKRIALGVVALPCSVAALVCWLAFSDKVGSVLFTIPAGIASAWIAYMTWREIDRTPV